MNFWKWTSLALAGLLVLVLGSGLVRPAAAGEQPHMRSALVNLKAAKGQLEKSSVDKGGHRVKAIELTQQAIDEVQKGVEAGGD
jgi:hypothetical protein